MTRAPVPEGVNSLERRPFRNVSLGLRWSSGLPSSKASCGRFPAGTARCRQPCSRRNENLRVILEQPGRNGTPFGFSQLFELIGAQVGAVGLQKRPVTAFGIQIEAALVDITIAQMSPVLFEEIVEGGYGEAAIDGDEHGLVILVAIPVKHDQDLIQMGKTKNERPSTSSGLGMAMCGGRSGSGTEPP